MADKPRSSLVLTETKNVPARLTNEEVSHSVEGKWALGVSNEILPKAPLMPSYIGRNDGRGRP